MKLLQNNAMYHNPSTEATVATSRSFAKRSERAVKQGT